jgi:hypothetical protein
VRRGGIGRFTPPEAGHSRGAGNVSGGVELRTGNRRKPRLEQHRGGGRLARHLDPGVVNFGGKARGGRERQEKKGDRFHGGRGSCQKAPGKAIVWTDMSDGPDLSEGSDFFMDKITLIAKHLNMYPDDEGPLLLHGGYRHLRSCQVAEAVCDATVVFCRRFVPRSDRTHDQMVQAVRSGVRNIGEDSGVEANSRKSEMKLTNVARASLNDELLLDFKSVFRQNGRCFWHKDSRECRAMRERTAKSGKQAGEAFWGCSGCPECKATRQV